MKNIKILLILLAVFASNGTIHAKEITLRDKIGQMLIIGFEGKSVNKHSFIVKAMDKYHIGGVILFDYHYQKKVFDKNIESPEQVALLNKNLQKYNALFDQKYQGSTLPLIICVDYEGGKVNRLKEQYGFPKTISAKAMGQLTISDAQKVAIDMALTLKKSGFNLNFAPVVDVDVNPENPVIGKLERSFSSSPKDVSLYGSIFSRPLLENKIQCAYKHFPGHGSSTADSHEGFVDVTNTWQEYELDPYRDLFNDKTSCGVVMTAHVVNKKLDETGLPATLSSKILTGVLRHQLNFDGVIVSDDMQMKAISDVYTLKNAITLAINAGVDMLVFANQLSEKPEDPGTIIDLIEAQVHHGEISQDRIDEAYQRIVRLKRTMA